MHTNWNKGNVNVHYSSAIIGIVAMLVDMIPRFGELQPMFVTTLLIASSAYIGIVKPSAPLLGVLFVWVWIPAERFTIFILSQDVSNFTGGFLRLIEFSVVSLLLCLLGLLSSLIARKYSEVQD